MAHNRELLRWGKLYIGYLVTIIFRDLLIYSIQLGSKQLEIFVKTLYVHSFCMPIDWIILLIIGLHGYHILQIDSIQECESDLECGKFVTIYRKNM